MATLRTLTALPVLILGLAMTGTEAQKPRDLVYRPNLVIQLGVRNLDKAIAFYQDSLQFTLSERRDDLSFAHIETNVPGVELGLNQVPAPKGSGSVVLNIGVAHVGNARRALEAKGVVFQGKTVVIPGKVALAGFLDQDGNALRLAGPPETAEPSR